MRKKYGAPGVSDEELVLRVIAGQTAVDEMMAAGAPKQYASWNHPLVSLIEELSRNKELSHVYIRKGDLSLAMRREINHKGPSANRNPIEKRRILPQRAQRAQSGGESVGCSD
ncbi:MAG: hypothetical protein ACREQV_25505 [Candidatus Binatia bacterium]